MELFEDAEIYVKDIMSIPIEMAIKDLNARLINDRVVPGLKILVSGGQVIHTYFPNSEPLKTHDYDLKLVAPKNINYTRRVRQRMVLLASGISRYIAIKLNEYIDTIYSNINKEIKAKFNVELVNKYGVVFSASNNMRTELLKTVPFKLKGATKIKTNSIADIYVVDPSELEHYTTFTGLPGSNQILSKNSGEYYIPYNEINGIPYAGLGYIIWDSIRMVRESKLRGLAKYSRYVDKRDAILNALNNPIGDLSCNAMKDYMLSCEKEYRVCKIKGKTYKSFNSLLNFAVEEGLIPQNTKLLKNIKDTYDFNYLCKSIKKVL